LEKEQEKELKPDVKVSEAAEEFEEAVAEQIRDAKRLVYFWGMRQ